MINGVSDYLLWPIRTLEQAQQDRARWRRAGFFSLPSTPKSDQGAESLKRLGAALQVSPVVRPAPPATASQDGLETQREEPTDFFR